MRTSRFKSAQGSQDGDQLSKGEAQDQSTTDEAPSPPKEALDLQRPQALQRANLDVDVDVPPHGGLGKSSRPLPVSKVSPEVIVRAHCNAVDARHSLPGLRPSYETETPDAQIFLRPGSTRSEAGSCLHPHYITTLSKTASTIYLLVADIQKPK